MQPAWLSWAFSRFTISYPIQAQSRLKKAKKYPHSLSMFQLDTEALVACLNGQSLSSSITLKPPNNKLLMIISSTFTDTMDERNLILGEISVYLQQVCKQKGLDVDVKFVDMRYGVRDENTLDYMTWV